MTIKSNGGVFGRNPTFNIVTAEQFIGPISGLSTSAAALKSSTTTGLMQITGPIAGQTRTMTIPDANFSAARTDAAQSFTGNQTLTDGNLIVANGKGIDFSATSGTGTSELFDDYEEGTWTPTLIFTTSSSGLTYTASGTYTKIGRFVKLFATISVSALGAASGFSKFGGFPFTFLSGGGMVHTLYFFNKGTSDILVQNFTGTDAFFGGTDTSNAGNGNFFFTQGNFSNSTFVSFSIIGEV